MNVPMDLGTARLLVGLLAVLNVLTFVHFWRTPGPTYPVLSRICTVLVAGYVLSLTVAFFAANRIEPGQMAELLYFLFAPAFGVGRWGYTKRRIVDLTPSSQT